MMVYLLVFIINLNTEIKTIENATPKVNGMGKAYAKIIRMIE